MKTQSKLLILVASLLLTAALAACSVPGSPVLDLKGSSWQVIEINGQAVSENIDLTANFSEDGQIAGNAACNQYFSDYTQDGSSLTFGMIGMTKMMCSDAGLMETESAFAQALESVQRFEEKGEIIRLLDADGKVVLVFGQPRPAPVLDQTSWQLTDLNGLALPLGVEITLEFGDGQITGKAACNSFFAGYTQDNYNLTITQVGGTEMYCDGLMDYESATYEALALVKTFELKNDVLRLKDASGVAILVYGAPQSAPNLAGTNWKVISVGEVQVAEGMEVTMLFQDAGIGGNSACNSYFADYTQDGASLTFGNAGSTMMYCEGEGIMAMETTFLSSLEKVRSFRFELGNLVFSDENGQTVIVLAPQ